MKNKQLYNSETGGAKTLLFAVVAFLLVTIMANEFIRYFPGGDLVECMEKKEIENEEEKEKKKKEFEPDDFFHANKSGLAKYSLSISSMNQINGQYRIPALEIVTPPPES